jgi:uncharacterized protein (UPF0332 family)
VNDDHRRTAVVQELHHSELASRAARLLRDAGLFNDALARLYYALYHSLTALLLTEGVEPRRHRALAGLIGTHFATVFDASERAAIARASTFRDLADYERTWDATAAIVDDAFAEIDPLLARVRDLLVRDGWL